MVRFFADKADFSNGLIQLNTEDAAHIRSLRLRPSEFFVVCDGEGSDHICRLAENSELASKVSKSKSEGAVAEVIETRPSRGEPSVLCSVYIALMKGDRLDYAVQKSVEMGAYEIVLFPSERCVSVPGDMDKKTARLQRIALETAKQCGRGRVPEVKSADSFKSAVLQASRAKLPLFFYECEEELHLKNALENSEFRIPNSEFNSVSIVTGPEGGFEPHEAELAQSAGLTAVTLGPRILRCETAPVAVLAAVMYHTGNL